MAHFILPESCWTDNFFAPQVKAQEDFLRRHTGNQAAIDLVASERHGAQLYSKYKKYYGYVFYIGRKI